MRRTKRMSETKAPKATSNKMARVRTASVSEVIRCGFPKCSYTANQTKTVESHRQKENNVDPDVPTLDGSISTSILDDTAVASETDNLASSLEHKTSSEFYSDMSKVEQSEPVMTQSPAKTDKENLNNSTNLLDETRDVGTKSDIMDGLNAGDEGDTQSLLMTMAQETISPLTPHNVSQPADSIALNMIEQDHEVNNLEDQLALRIRTRSLKDKEVQRLSGIIKALKDGLAKPSEAVATKDAKSNKSLSKHVIGARKLFHEEKKKQKEEKEREKEENKKEDKKEEGKGGKAKERAEPGHGKRKKKKKPGNKEPKTETKDGKSTVMDVDEVTVPSSNSDANAKTNHQGKVNGAPGPQQSTFEAQPPQQAANSRLQPSQLPTIPLDQVATRFQQQQIPTSFNFGQQQFTNHREVTDFKEVPLGLPPGLEPHSWRWRLYEGNF